MNKTWKIFIIHHSHTDIGYTERQDKIIRYHYYFIKQAIEILDKIHNGELKDCEGFKWQCENYWQVENFYSYATKKEIHKFEEYVKSKEIGISGNYFNLTELIDESSLSHGFDKMRKYGIEKKIDIKCGMSADINGFSWGYGDVLFDNGIKNFYSCLHPHHGMFPLFKKQIPFYWETPKGNKVLVWNGEHYHVGNELFLAPYAGNSYMYKDEYHKPINENFFFNSSREETELKEKEICKNRIEKYLNNLEKEEYPYDFVPVMVSGALTDNGFPNPDLAKRVNELNKEYDNKISFEIVTLDTLFSHIRNNCLDIKSYKGDWTDWWADGIGSTPSSVMVFREAQRKLDLCEKLDPKCELIDKIKLDKVKDELLLFSEHTWGYSSSVSEPWDFLVVNLETKKNAYATNANTQVSFALDEILAKKGECGIRYQRHQNFKVINPHPFKVMSNVKLFVEYWEYLDGIQFCLDTQFEVVDKETGKVIPHQIVKIPRAYEIEIILEMEAKAEKIVYLRLASTKRELTIKNHAHIGADQIEDIVINGEYEVSVDKIETDYFEINLSQDVGIVSIIDKSDKTNILKDDFAIAPFNGCYEITKPKDNNQLEVRRKMGRSRKSPATQRFVGKLTNLEIIEEGQVYVKLKLEYKLKGTRIYNVFFKIFKHLPKIDVSVILNKKSRWDPENVYVSLPFELDNQSYKYIDKTGAIIRPGIDQLPGSCTEFYLLQNGVVLENEHKNLIISTLDAPLVTFGSLDSKAIRLDIDGKEFNKKETYSWIMNNYWETNFKVDLGGFYEFHYSIEVTQKEDITMAFEKCKQMNEGLISMYI